MDVIDSRDETVGRIRVRRALPRTGRRTIGAWCFADHMGPVDVTEEHGLDIGPHPHTGLQTVTWLVAGQVLHRDSLGSEQLIAPGQLNLMTAGRGVAHAEEATGAYRGPLHGIQLWIAQPEATRHGAAAFEHHASLPQAEVGAATATVLVGELGGARSPARHDGRFLARTARPSRADTSGPQFELCTDMYLGEVHIAIRFDLRARTGAGSDAGCESVRTGRRSRPRAGRCATRRPPCASPAGRGRW